jgi:soluble lytic murein transglycosylase-like protein
MGRLSRWIAAAVGLWFVMVPQTTCAAQDRELDRLLDAIAQVESRGNPTATGDNGAAVGVYQIHRPYWADGTRILGVKWSYREARDPQKARQVVRAYLRHYGKGKTPLDMARIHNGGPRGHAKAATLEYARKIEQVLSGLS